MPEQQQPVIPVVVSEVAAMRERIKREHEAACYALTASCIGAAKHWFISRRMERIGGYQQHLSETIGEEASMDIVMAVLEESPPQRKEEEQRHATGHPKKH